MGVQWLETRDYGGQSTEASPVPANCHQMSSRAISEEAMRASYDEKVSFKHCYTNRQPVLITNVPVEEIVPSLPTCQSSGSSRGVHLEKQTSLGQEEEAIEISRLMQC